MKILKYTFVTILCVALGTGLFWAATGSCQADKGAAGNQAGKPAGDKGTQQTTPGVDVKQDQKTNQAEDPRAAAEPAPTKKARGAFNPTEGC